MSSSTPQSSTSVERPPWVSISAATHVGVFSITLETREQCSDRRAAESLAAANAAGFNV